MALMYLIYYDYYSLVAGHRVRRYQEVGMDGQTDRRTDALKVGQTSSSKYHTWLPSFSGGNGDGSSRRRSKWWY